MKGCRLAPGHLNTRDERRGMRMLADDLERQLDRATDSARARELARQIDAIRREQAYDKQVSPKGKKAHGKGGKR